MVYFLYNTGHMYDASEECEEHSDLFIDEGRQYEHNRLLSYHNITDMTVSFTGICSMM